ncbi:ribonuclease Le37 [Lentinula edodes]|nr:ribonuclease Le37 [Lentinula edodes]KAJ3917108.1 ribonuclease Le37 [Lentinula edodes]
MIVNFALSFIFASLALASPLTSSNPLGLGGQFDVFARNVAISSGCSTTGTASCHNTSAVSNTCCFEAPGGLILQTQACARFWDTDPSTGPSNSWTIHGLWPDNCDGTFSENCDPSRDQSAITSLLESAGATSTLSFMQTYWKNDPDDGSDEELWSHEWDTHGTCYSTLEPSCLPSGSPSGTDAVAFYETVVRLFQTLPTYTWLANQGITPSSSTTHTLTSLENALAAEAGVTPMLTCDGSNLNEIAWYFNLKGSIIDGTFVPIDSPEDSDCPSSGIKYPLKTGSPVSTTSVSSTTTTTTTTGTPTSTGTPGPLPTKAMIVAIHNGAQVGGLLTLGTWSTQTLATMTLAGSTSSFTMTSSKGSCGVSGGELTCGSGVSATSFTAISSGGSLLLASGGSTAFSSSAVPSGETVETVFTGSGKAQTYTLAIVST